MIHDSDDDDYKYFVDNFVNEDSDDDHEFMMISASTLAYKEYEAKITPKWGGSVPGRKYLNRGKEAANYRLWNDYFADEPVYDDRAFRRRFRMSKEVFLRIVDGVTIHDDYFRCKRDAAGKLGFTPLQKCTLAMRMLAYGATADAIDENLRLAEATSLKTLRRFVRAVVAVFGEEYLREPTPEDTQRLMAIGETRGFPGLLGSIDCMHWAWKNCPCAWAGQYQGHVKEPTIILEAVASMDLWIWHAFFGMPGSHNDINVLHRSPIFARLAEGNAPECNYVVNGHEYKMGYYLADGIYPQWAAFVKTISNPQGNKKAFFAKMQEGVWKDVERAFGVLQARWSIVRGPARIWDEETLWYIMTACIIMHNMIIEDERGEELNLDFEVIGEPVVPSHQGDALTEFLEMHRRIQDRQVHSHLQDDLVEHVWAWHGTQ